MHRSLPPNLTPPRSQRGFSLPEVAMAIGIIAVAFVTLLSLLPAGLNTYRAAIDEANETWIIQSMNSMVQTTDFSQVQQLDYQTSGNIFYFDEEGKLTDTELKQGDAKVKETRIYAVKLIIGDLFRPDGEIKEGGDQKMNHGFRVITAIAPVRDPKAMLDFGRLNTVKTLDDLPLNSNVHTRAFYVARMDSQPPSNEPTP